MKQTSLVRIAVAALFVGSAVRVLAAGPAFVQENYATPQTKQSTVTVKYSAAQKGGDINILAIGWNDATSNIVSVTDTEGNVYQAASGTFRGTALSQAIYYAKNIAAAGAGANTVTVTFNAAVFAADVRITEYSGLDTANPFDVASSAKGSGTSANSGSVTTRNTQDLVFGAGMTQAVFNAAGSGFTKRVITSPDGDIAEDKTTTSTGSYGATATGSSGAWVMQMAAFKAAPVDTQAPSVPTNLQAIAVSASQINLSWASSTDNVGVAGYKIFRNGAQVGTSTAVTYSDMGLAQNTTYTYTVSAFDAAGNVSAQSSSTSATTPSLPPPVINSFTVTPTSLLLGQPAMLSWNVLNATSISIDNGVGAVTGTSTTVFPAQTTTNGNGSTTAQTTVTLALDTQPPTIPANLTATAVSTSEINLSWASSTDNVGVAGYSIYRNNVLVAFTTSTSYGDIGLTPGTTYAYNVTAQDAAGNVSGLSNTAIATTQMPDVTPPTVPTGLQVANITGHSLILSWASSTDDVGVAGYQVFRNGFQVGTTTATSYADAGLATSTTYAYTVSAFDVEGNISAQSVPAFATTSSGSIGTAVEENADYSADNGSSSIASVTANVNVAGDLVAITAWCYPSCNPVNVTLGNQMATETTVSGVPDGGNPGAGQGFIFYVLSAAAAGPQTLTFTATGTYTDIQTSYIDFTPSAGATFSHDIDSPLGSCLSNCGNSNPGTINAPSITANPGDVLFNFTWSSEHVNDINAPWSCPVYSGQGETQDCQFNISRNVAAYILSAPSSTVANNTTDTHASDVWQALLTSFTVSD